VIGFGIITKVDGFTMEYRLNCLIDELKQTMPSDLLLMTEAERRPFECDGLSAYRQLPGVVVLAETVEHLAQVLRLCEKHQVPVVARGAGTSLSAGALPHQEGVLLSLAKFNRIVDINETHCTATVQPGVRNLAISEAVSHLGLYYAPDPSSQIACTIGGNVAENAGGVHCLKYGLTLHNVLEVKLLTMQGELLTLNNQHRGYDLLALITGSEGLLGLIVEVTVKLLPKPDTVEVLMAAFDSVEKAAHSVSEIIARGIIPAGLEMMDRLAIKAAEDFIHAGYPVDAAAILLCELDGAAAETRSQLVVVKQLLMDEGATQVQVAKNAAQRQQLWQGRKSAFPAVGRLAPDYYCMDGTIPRKNLAKVLVGIQQLSEHYQLPVANVFHAGDGNLHPLILYDANISGELARTEEFGGKILKLCLDMGGTITGEHGVGAEKLDQMCDQFNAAELAQFHALKAAFDPQGLLNPGKAVPTLHRCAELGAMHVHNGELPFPDLPRF
jgi:glycolate oxidase